MSSNLDRAIVQFAHKIALKQQSKLIFLGNTLDHFISIGTFVAVVNEVGTRQGQNFNS